MNYNQPIVGIPVNTMQINSFVWHGASDANIKAVKDIAQCQPLLIPAQGEDLAITDILNRLDGILLPGGASNIQPSLYGGPPARSGDLNDPCRDSTTIPLIHKAVDMRVPLFAICRGCQELNVAFGGSLYPYLHELPERLDHRRDRTKPLAEQVRPTHEVNIRDGGPLHFIVGQQTAMVNSLHGQGIDQLGSGLTAEARALDSTIEAISIDDAQAWTLGVQWHPEFQAATDPLSKALFVLYGSACQSRAKERDE